MKKYLVNFCFLIVAGIFVLSGCAGTQKVTKLTPIQDLGAPEWVIKGSGAFGGERGRVFYGVGVADKSTSMSIMRSQADLRARDGLVKVLQVYNASLSRDYEASTKAGDISGVPEGYFEKVIKQVTAMTLSGSEIVDHWQNPATGELYALARLDFEGFTDNLDKVRDLDGKVRDYIKNNAERLHDQLENEEEKVGAR